MRVLLVKTSSMGDVIHALPALTDALARFPDLKVDWVVEEGFAEIPGWHPAVDRVIPVSIRRWRKQWLKSFFSGEIKAFRAELTRERYDRVIDAQGLLKSAWITRQARGLTCGMDRNSAREPVASHFYKKSFPVARQQHAVERIRQLFAQALEYPVPTEVGAFGVQREQFLPEVVTEDKPYVVFLHGTTRDDKHWPEPYWQTLCGMMAHRGYQIRLPWGNERERQRAEAIARITPAATVLPRLSLAEIATQLVGASGAVAVDTGLGHLAAALAVPTVSLYGPTSPDLIGAYGAHQRHLRATDYTEIPQNGSGKAVDPAIFAPLHPALVKTALLDLM
ncbi:lipopolysaccharide heptosyltransferase RfaC [Aestuariirhabdus litorea]|uniref:Lipopolysaccharide heptosyltransferase 1 n=1 Tax=Aestuariirhabdus litorea TaxID=2528527 RepID=A0A3P3VI15_9GAMM|nr:lipopolysaccharide heptosyltransferase RfaC [Aestuariirhabdus litorea]RRJ82360.1 lipopolysaccharide heptosyltransferase RfaC [Aestuariirhabdus litorea]RWW92524.1 lipopolysaccharide heptosyltransferase RfaC [Endozoicomonadaceae bacterium GTF-13]